MALECVYIYNESFYKSGGNSCPSQKFCISFFQFSNFAFGSMI